jgi:hypothetical protein
MQITQAYVAPAVRFFAERFRRKFGLTPCVDPTAPAIFFGCYDEDDCHAVLTHKALAVIAWAGSDSMRLTTRHHRAVLAAPHVRHIAPSTWIAKDLLGVNARFKSLALSTVEPERFQPCALGPAVYVYSSHSNPDFYGAPIIREVQAALPGLEFITRHADGESSEPHESMPSIYARCFMGLRLVPHDGLSDTVVELALMGRRCVWNGGFPGSIPWTTLGDVLGAIDFERHSVGTTNERLADRSRREIALPPEWLTTEFYG